jgi:hypothetical protein
VAVRTKPSVIRYVAAGAITLLIFALGVMLGLVFDYERIESLQNQNSGQELGWQSLQLQYLYLSTIENSTAACPVLQKSLENSIKELGKSLEKLQDYEKNTQVNQAEYSVISRKYLLDNFRYWVFSSSVGERCQQGVINVLYFYSLKDCSVCPNQGVILTNFKTKLQDQILIFPINTDVPEDFTGILMLQYNITRLPALVINGQSYQGVVPRDELARIICEASRDKERCLV